VDVDLIARTGLLVGAGTVSVSLWTVRVALTARGRQLGSSLTAGVEAVVFALAFASVLASLHSPVEVAGYAVGVALGTLLGVKLDSRLSTGQSTVRVFVNGDGEQLARVLRAACWPVVRLGGEGVQGAAALLLVVLDDARLPRLLADLRALTPEAFWTVERLQAVQPSLLPAGYRQIGRATGRRSRPGSWRRLARA
jgi:uncharacterized protein YebE (UPF0316 family)